MKKFSILAITILFSTQIFSQTKLEINPVQFNAKKIVQSNYVDNSKISNSALSKITNKTKISGVNAIFAGSSINYFGASNSNLNLLSANQDLNLIMFGHRGGPTNGNGNQIFSSISNDLGVSWDTNNLIYNNPNLPARYPCSSIFNPTGNTNIDNAYQIVFGSSTNSDQNYFSGEYISWKKNNSTTFKYSNIPHNNSNRFSGYNFTTASNGKIWLAGTSHIINSFQNLIDYKFLLISGIIDTNNDTIILNEKNIEPPFWKSQFSNLPEFNAKPTIAFSKDGSVGYYITIGINKEDSTNISYRPIVYKTTDSGNSWNLLNDYNLGQINTFKKYLPSVWQDQSTIIPYITDVCDAVVDGNNNLHLVAYVYGCATSDVDSISYIWRYNNAEGILFDLFTTDTGWDAEKISIVYSKNYEPASSSNNIKTNARAQASVSSDGQKVFFTWADSDVNQQEYNITPNMYVMGIDINSRKKTERLNCTENTNFNSMAFLHTTAPEVWKNNDHYTIHSVVGLMGNNQILDPVSFFYLKGLKVYENDFTYNNNEVVNLDRKSITVSQNYPNPAVDYTNINVDLSENCNLKIQITNLMGQVVYLENYGELSIGNYKLIIPLKGLKSGVYFYCIKADDKDIENKKLIVN